MKKSIVTFTFVLIAFIGFGQKIKAIDLPAEVKSAFENKYRTATDVKWNKENGNIEASFDLDKVDNSVLIDPSGKILETEVEIEINRLPKGIVEFVKINYKGASIKEAAKITDALGAITYEAAIKGKDLIFDNSGKFLKEIKD